MVQELLEAAPDDDAGHEDAELSVELIAAELVELLVQLPVQLRLLEEEVAELIPVSLDDVDVLGIADIPLLLGPEVALVIGLL
jgi:hypothetical protein